MALPNSTPYTEQLSNEDVAVEPKPILSTKLKKAWSTFASFALRDKVLEVVVGMIIGTAFTSVVNSLASGVLLPPVSLLPYMSRDMAEKFLVLRQGPQYRSPGGYNTRSQAPKDGAVILTYGAFLNSLLNFIGIVVMLYLFARVYELFGNGSLIEPTKCPYCTKEVHRKAKRCPLCTSWFDGREHIAVQAADTINELGEGGYAFLVYPNPNPRPHHDLTETERLAR